MGAKIILTIEYEGTRYHGSQYQINAPTIQGEIEEALKKLTGIKTRIKAASRTDAGVHAFGQVISFHTGADLPLKAFVNGLNHYLPDDIAVRGAYYDSESLDVRRDAVSREYRYRILNSPAPSPLRRGYSFRVGGNLDVEAMGQAFRTLIGRHDFASFVSSVETARNKRTVRHIFKAEISRDGDMIVLDMVANSFLPHQVRNLIGSLIEVGRGKMTVDEFSRMVESAQPGLAGPAAPPEGLCLMRVNYPGPFKGDAK